MNERQEKILRILKNERKFITGKEFAELLNVSDRTVRSDIEQINKSSSKPIIISDRHKGYSLENNSIKPMKSDLIKKNDIPQTPGERTGYILRRLLISDKEINVSNLQDEIFVSSYSLENDLRKVREKLKQNTDLKLVRSKNFIKLEGSENEKRKLYKTLLEEETKGNFLNMNKLASLYTEFDLLEVKKILDATLDKYDFHIREMSMPMLMMHIGICLARLLHHNYVQTDIKKEELENTVEYKIAKDFFNRVSKEIKVEMVEDEILKLTLLLMGKKNNRFRSENIALKSSDLPISEIVDELLQKIFDKFNIDLRYDTELKIGLELHIQGVAERQFQGVIEPNVYLQETKKNYPLIFEMGIWAGQILSKALGFTITEDEIGFLALHLGSAYERSSVSKNYRALLIYPDEQVLSKMCYEKISNRFHERMDIIGHMNVFERKKVQEADPDLIITTLPLEHDLPIPTVQISLFVNSNDESKIFYVLNDLDKIKNQDEFEDFIKDIMYPDLFYVNMDVDSPEEIINFMCKEMRKKDLIPDGFKESVMEREKYSSTSIGYGLAIPHALNVMANYSCISVAILKEPIKWGIYDVSMVILLGIREEDKKLMGIFFDWLSNVVSETNKFSELLKVTCYKDFIASIE
ncbi:PRD domain-containing protein [Erysipelotrichaceae bacterium HCN-30851]